MKRDFELFVAIRYLRARRKTAVVSVVTVISIVGVAAGVMALVIALAVNNGFRHTLQANLLGATAHVSILESVPADGITNWRELEARLRKLPHVIDVSPSLYGSVLVSGPGLSSGAMLKGIRPENAVRQTEMLGRLKEGSIQRLHQSRGFPGIVLGSKLAQTTGMMLNSVVTVIIPYGDVTPMGVRPAAHRFRVVGIFESGFYEL
ncbi:MAG TPA: ABC transporter permease, partial [Bryobacteraceae bacterium]|nr:ABC transporter permease [Bryobacteraceae bacterium]